MTTFYSSFYIFTVGKIKFRSQFKPDLNQIWFPHISVEFRREIFFSTDFRTFPEFRRVLSFFGNVWKSCVTVRKYRSNYSGEFHRKKKKSSAEFYGNFLAGKTPFCATSVTKIVFFTRPVPKTPLFDSCPCLRPPFFDLYPCLRPPFFDLYPCLRPHFFGLCRAYKTPIFGCAAAHPTSILRVPPPPRGHCTQSGTHKVWQSENTAILNAVQLLIENTKSFQRL